MEALAEGVIELRLDDMEVIVDGLEVVDDGRETCVEVLLKPRTTEVLKSVQVDQIECL